MGHPLEKFKFCPVCGSRRWVEHDFKSKACQDCGFVYYANPSSATAAFILNGRGELLVVRRAKEPSKGTLDLPGGFVDIGEDIEQGMRREIAEETGLVVEDIKYIFSTCAGRAVERLRNVERGIIVLLLKELRRPVHILRDVVRRLIVRIKELRRAVERFLRERLWEKY